MTTRSPNLFSNDWPNRFYKARMRNIRWDRGVTKLGEVPGTTVTNEQNQTPYVGTGTDEQAAEQQTIQDLENSLNGK